jgi:hypothetical protein
MEAAESRPLAEDNLWLEVSSYMADKFLEQRQTIVSQFYQLDRLVVEGGKSVRLTLAVLVLTAPLPKDLLLTLRSGQANRRFRRHCTAERHRASL